MQRTLRVTFAVSLGSFIGAMVALEFGANWWWLGALLGGAVSWASYETKRLVTAVPTAWSTVSSWRPDHEYWRMYWAGVGYANNLGVIVGFPLAIIGGWQSYFGDPSVAVGTLGTGFLFLVSFFIFGLCGWSDPVPGPLTFWFLRFPRGVAIVVSFVYRERRKIARIGKRLTFAALHFARVWFWLVHSDIRQLCFVDGAIGATIGYFCGSALIGAVAGAMWGAFNFEILSIRVLKLVPRSQSVIARW